MCAATACLIAVSAGAGRAAPLSDCTAHRGTIVAVDFSHWGGPLVRGCGVSQTSGYDLLHAAGFVTASDDHDGPGFICRLGDTAFHRGTPYPTPSEVACVQTPPASASWSYWLAPAGHDKWSYSSLGAMNDVPKPGEVELWTFGSTDITGSDVPSLSPDSIRTHTAAPPTQTTTTSTTPAATTSSTTTATTTTTRSSTTTPKPAKHSAAPRVRKKTRPRRPARTGLTGRSTARSPSTSNPPLVAAKPTSERTSTGSAVPLIIGICLAGVLCGGAGWAAWRRRRYE